MWFLMAMLLVLVSIFDHNRVGSDLFFGTAVFCFGVSSIVDILDDILKELKRDKHA